MDQNHHSQSAEHALGENFFNQVSDEGRFYTTHKMRLDNFGQCVFYLELREDGLQAHYTCRRSSQQKYVSNFGE